MVTLFSFQRCSTQGTPVASARDFSQLLWDYISAIGAVEEVLGRVGMIRVVGPF
jgi:hypothetical protein